MNTVSQKGIVVNTSSVNSKDLQRQFAEIQTCILNALPAHIAVIDSEGSLIDVNVAWCHFARDNELKDASCGVGQNYLALCDNATGPYSDEAPLVAAGIRQLLSGERDSFALEYPCHSPSEQRWFRLMAAPIRADLLHGAVIMHIDITQRKLSELVSQRAACVFQSSNDGIVITDNRQTIVDVNPAFTRITGYRAEEVVGRHSLFFNADSKSSELYRAMQDAINASGYWHHHMRSRRRDGEIYIEDFSLTKVTTDAGDLANYIGVFSDITQLKIQEEKLRRAAQHDALTGLPNRRLLTDRLEHGMRQAKRSQNSLAICYIDLDDFKPINDNHGHEVGDSLLKDIATRLLHLLRETDTVARLGGDEFVVLLTGLGVDEALHPVLERIMDSLQAPVKINELVVRVRASIGVTVFPDDDSDADALLRHADQAMYTAKEQGRNRYHIYDARLAKRVEARWSQLNTMDKGLQNAEFVLYFQPKVNLRTGALIGVEALVRWQHPTRGLLAPAHFLEDLMGSHLEIPFGDYVLEQALAQMDLWANQGIPMSVSINISANELKQAELTNKIQAALARHPQLSPSSLEIEVLETSAIQDVPQVVRALVECRALGVQVSLDDFGTGYSSLTIFRQLPLDAIKIDRSFVKNILSDETDRGIVRCIVQMAQTMRRNVIAEGVETLEHASALLQLGCELAQGYGIARPMPAKDIPGWVTEWQTEKPWQALL